MRRIQAIGFEWGAMALTAIVSVMTLTGAAASSPSEPQVATQTNQAVATDAPAGSAAEVKIDNFAFTPGMITVKAGTQVTWINHDDIPHTVDSTEGKFKSSAMDTHDKFQFRFTEPGEYQFYCRLHPKMTGKVVVQP